MHVFEQGLVFQHRLLNSLTLRVVVLGKVGHEPLRISLEAITTPAHRNIVLLQERKLNTPSDHVVHRDIHPCERAVGIVDELLGADVEFLNEVRIQTH